MKSNPRKHLFVTVLIFLLLLFLSVFFNYRYAVVSKSPVNKEKFQSVLYHHNDEMMRLSLKILEQLTDTPGQLWDELDESMNGPYSLLVYHHGSLIGWNSQLLPITDDSYSVFDSAFVQLPNGYYYSTHLDSLDYRIVAVRLIQHNYPYQNQYIRNDFDPSFSIQNQGVSISIEEKENGVQIVDVDGSYLFTLVQEYGGQNGENWVYLSIITLVLSLIFLFYSISYYLRKIKSGKIGLLTVLVISAFFALFYYLFFVLSWYKVTDSIEIFSPLHFAYSEWLSSLGDFMILSVFMVYITFLIYKYYKNVFIVFHGKSLINFHIGLAIVLAYYYLINTLFIITIKHSSDLNVFSNIVDIDIITISKIFVIFFLFVSFTLLFEKLIVQFSEKLSKANMLLGVISLILLLWIITFYYNSDISNLCFIFFIVVSVYFIFIKQKGLRGYSYRDFLWMVLIFDIFIVAQTFLLNIKKEKESRMFLIESLANNLEGEQDPVAEMFLTDLENSIKSDPNIKDMIENDDIYDEDLRQYLIKNYFLGYLSRYDVQVVLCFPEAELYVNGSSMTYDCYNYFDSLIVNTGEILYGSNHFYFLKKNNGRISYFGTFKYFENDANFETRIFLELISKPFFEGLGYPELLISDKEKNKLDILKGYSYAKYVDGNLVKKSGDYLYKLHNDQFFTDSLSDKKFIALNHYSHLVYSPYKNVEVVMSYPLNSVSNVLISFSILYIIFILLTFAIVYIARFFQISSLHPSTIQERIQILMVLLMVFLLLVIGTSSVFYSISQFKEKNNEMLSQRLKSILLELEQSIGNENKLTEDMGEYLNVQLQKFSNIFYCDINLYNLDGEILATSRPELYQKGIMGNFMNPEAYKKMLIDGEREYIHNESIGHLNYISAYVPFLNQNNNVLAYVNLPYFVGTNELKNEISSVLVAIINTYLIFILIAISIAVFATRQVTRPLLVIQQRLSKTRFGSKIERIEYNREDEIGQLVNEYNHMVDELAISAEKLAKSEREGAWREMAKQIAHEIKNPLTPMKLSVQYLQKAWDDKVDDFDSYIKRVTDTLTDQINQLSVIATEFSHFAKMPVAKREPINMMEKLKNTVTMFERSSKIQFIISNKGPEKIIVNFDGEQILSVFNNLIKNAVQSIPNESEGVININITVKDNRVIMEFHDNGKGIPEDIREKLFTPNFTTKSSGMGLGLAIVKNIIESSGGKIWFETEINSGTTFYVSLPLFDDIK